MNTPERNRIEYPNFNIPNRKYYLKNIYKIEIKKQSKFYKEVL